MLVALLNSNWDPNKAITPYVRETIAIIERIRKAARRCAARRAIRGVKTMLINGRYYEAVVSTLEARSVAEDIEGPDRVEVLGRRLCYFFREAFPLAPAGFERVGRMRNADRVRGRGGDDRADDRGSLSDLFGLPAQSGEQPADPSSESSDAEPDAALE